MKPNLPFLNRTRSFEDDLRSVSAAVHMHASHTAHLNFCVEECVRMRWRSNQLICVFDEWNAKSSQHGGPVNSRTFSGASTSWPVEFVEMLWNTMTNAGILPGFSSRSQSGRHVASIAIVFKNHGRWNLQTLTACGNMYLTEKRIKSCFPAEWVISIDLCSRWRLAACLL